LAETNGLLASILTAMQRQPVPMGVQTAVQPCPVDSEQPSTTGSQAVYTHDLIVEGGQSYTRRSHPKLFRCVELLEGRGGVGGMSYRAIAKLFETETGSTISPTWAGVAKNYWLSQRCE
jgi:hypothetical protein